MILSWKLIAILRLTLNLTCYKDTILGSQACEELRSMIVIKFYLLGYTVTSFSTNSMSPSFTFGITGMYVDIIINNGVISKTPHSINLPVFRWTSCLATQCSSQQLWSCQECQGKEEEAEGVCTANLPHLNRHTLFFQPQLLKDLLV